MCSLFLHLLMFWTKIARCDSRTALHLGGGLCPQQLQGGVAYWQWSSRSKVVFNTSWNITFLKHYFKNKLINNINFLIFNLFLKFDMIMKHHEALICLYRDVWWCVFCSFFVGGFFSNIFNWCFGSCVFFFVVVGGEEIQWGAGGRESTGCS